MGVVILFPELNPCFSGSGGSVTGGRKTRVLRRVLPTSLGGGKQFNVLPWTNVQLALVSSSPKSTYFSPGSRQQFYALTF